MTAYGFRARFVPLVESGAKRQTLRKNRGRGSRHARPGELVQLYEGMRTPACRKIRPDARCTAVLDVAMALCPGGGPEDNLVVVDGRALSGPEMEAFARADGFADLDDMAAWFEETHGAEPFHGVVIKWSVDA